jgi:nucleoside-diphosphate-sugar epimerase
MNDKNKLIEHIKHNIKLKINNTSIMLDFISIDYLIELISIILKKKHQNNFEIYNCCSGVALTPIEIINLLPEKRLKKINMKHLENNIKISNTENKYCIWNNDKIIKKLKIKKLDVNKKITNYFNTKT